jgi:hypothetical protein
VLKNIAGLICPLNSKTLIVLKLLANNLFHKICEEASAAGGHLHLLSGMGLYQPWRVRCLIRKRAGRPRCCPVFERAEISPLNSSAWLSVAGLAHIVFHSLCAQLAGRTDKPWCPKNGLDQFSLMNQGVYHCCVRLRTILSTKNVKKKAGV